MDELLCDSRSPAHADLLAAIAADADAYRRRFGQPPTVAWCHPQALNGVRRVGEIELRPREGVGSVRWFYLSISNE